MAKWLIDHLINEIKPEVWGLHIFSARLQHFYVFILMKLRVQKFRFPRILASHWNKEIFRCLR